MQTHFPSGDGSDLGVGLLLAPFRGVRYDLSRVGGLANVTSPPYDVIGATALDELLLADPHNVVRLILPARVEAGESMPDGALGDSKLGVADLTISSASPEALGKSEGSTEPIDSLSHVVVDQYGNHGYRGRGAVSNHSPLPACGFDTRPNGPKLTGFEPHAKW